MISISLPDGSSREFKQGVSGADVAAAIGPGLAKAALAIKLDGVMTDLITPIAGDAAVEIITVESPEALDLIRHDAAHVMAEAVKELYPETQITIGPNIEDGFFYDFARESPFSPDDFAVIEKRMHEIVKRDEEQTYEMPHAFVAAYVGPEQYVPALVGLDYRAVGSHGAYRQCIRHAIRMAESHGSSRVLLGMGAEQEKERFGAKRVQRSLYVQSRDHYQHDVLSLFAMDATS